MLQRREHRAAGAQHHRGLTLPDALPLVVPLGHPQAAVQQRHPVPEIGGEPRHHLGRQGDLRHKDHHGSSLCQQLLRQPDIHQRFAAAGDALQQRHAALAGQRPLQDIFIRLLLLVVQCNAFCLYGI